MVSVDKPGKSALGPASWPGAADGAPPQEAQGKVKRRVVRSAALSLAAWWLLAWAGAQALIVRAELAHADALVVLAGSSAYTERALHAAQLFGEGRAPAIILTHDGERSGWSDAEQRNPFFVERAAEELRRAGVPAERIQVLPRAVSSTHEEAILLREYTATHQLHSVLFVTSAYHSRRALWISRHVLRGSGVEVGLSAPAPGRQMPSPMTWWWRPRGWRIVAGEYVKLAYYRLRY
ncbi:MAG: YdcF family protein [Acidobacteriota bacterium]|nr:YdcF family protein [Acidobacteriota bacterium]